MPKMKTNKAALKRFRVTKNGKVKRKGAFTSHLMSSRTTKRKRSLRRAKLVHARDVKTLLRMMGH